VAAALWRHYGGDVESRLARDATMAGAGDVDGLIAHVKMQAKRIDSAVPEAEDLLYSIIGEGAMFLALLVYFMKVSGRSFPSGKLLSGVQEPLEVHQLFPRALIDRFPERDNQFVPDRLGNLTLLARSDSEHIASMSPHVYLQGVEPSERSAHLIPDDPSLWNVAQYHSFCEQRERLMASMLRDLLFNLGAT
jgi:hypothetical protein